MFDMYIEQHREYPIICIDPFKIKCQALGVTFKPMSYSLYLKFDVHVTQLINITTDEYRDPITP